MKWKRITAILMTAVMTLTMPGVPTLAVEIGASVVDTGLCEHHPEHTEDCGYTEGETGTPCSHEHTEDCYTLVKKCVHEHDASCYSDYDASGLENTATASDPEKIEATACEHECSEESGCITKELNCVHERGEHDDTCGYVPVKEGTLCTHVCEICDSLDDSEDGKKTGTADGIHGENACVYCGMTCRHENVENGICQDCRTNGIIAKVDGTAYMSFTDALAAVRNSDGKTLKLCANAQYVGYDPQSGLDSLLLGYKKLTIDLNGYRLSAEEGAIKGICVVDGAELVIVDSSENKSGSVDSINVTVAITAAGGKLTLESGAIDSLMVDSSSVVTLNGGRLRYLTTGSESSQLCYRVGRLFEHSGRYLKNESTGEVADLSKTSVGSDTSNDYYTIMTAPAEVSEGSKSGNTPINKKRVPFDVSVTPADNTGIASVKFDWYLAGLGAEASKPALASYTAAASENGTYNYDPAQASADPTAWADMKIDDTKELCCIMTAQDADGKAIWLIAASDYMLTIDKTSIEDAVITSLNGHGNALGKFIVFPKTNSAEADKLKLDFKV